MNSKRQQRIQSVTQAMLQKNTPNIDSTQKLTRLETATKLKSFDHNKKRYDPTVREDEEKQSLLRKVMDFITEKIKGKNWKTQGNKNKQRPLANDDNAQISKENVPIPQQDQQNDIKRQVGGLSIEDLIAPIDLEIDFNHIQIGKYFYKTFFVSKYPRFVGPNWLSQLISFEHSVNISTFYYPVDTKLILQKLKKKIGELEATLYSQMEKRQVIDPSVKVALSDAQKLQDSIAEGSEKFFHFAMYIAVPANSRKKLEKISKNIESTLAAMNITAKSATLQQEQGFISCQPVNYDRIYITRNMDTTSLATTFPFVTSELTMDHGIMYGINQHNKSLVIFDRFDMENANSVVFAKSGAGKSYFVKLEAIRSLMFGTNIIIIDPEQEFDRLCDAVGGSYISFSQNTGQKINPFELSGLGDEEDDELRSKILTLIGFIKLLLGKLSNEELAILDRALLLTYREKGITLDPATQRNHKPPLLEDLYKVLKGMAAEEAHQMARRLERYIVGSAAGIFNEESTIELDNPFIVFSVRDLQEELRPMGMYLILDFIWTRIRKDQRKRLLIVDEAWYMMTSPDSAKFLYSMAKRARKYYLGVTTITQDVSDFLQNDFGKAIINNSSIQFLMMQSPNAIDRIAKVFNLSQGEKSFLLSCDKGQGLFFAGQNHVAIQVIASQMEHEIITTNPKDLENLKLTSVKIGSESDQRSIAELAEMYAPPSMQNPMDLQKNKRNRELITEAVEERKEDIEQVMRERLKYEGDNLDIDGVESPEETTAKMKRESQASGRPIPSLTEQVVQERQEIQKGMTHLTPQGIVGDEQEKTNDK